MNVQKASNAVETNHKLFGPYARKLESDNLETYTTFSEKLAKWLGDERAYYPTARPQILKLLKIAQLTLRRNTNADLDLNAPFHISSCVEHPMVGPYSKLLKAVHPHKDLFVEPELHAEVKSLFKTIVVPTPIHIDLTSEPNSPIAPSPAYTANSTMQASTSPIASFPLHSPPPRWSQTNSDPSAVPEVNSATRGASDSTDLDTRPGNMMNGALPVHSGTTPSMKNSETSSSLNVASLATVTSSHASSASSPQLSNTISETTTISKVKKKKKKKAGFGLESLIQADIQDLQKRGVAGVNIKAEPTNVTIPNLVNNTTSNGGFSHRDIVVLDDEPTETSSEIAPPPSSSSPMQLVGQTPISESTLNGADMAVDRVSPHHSDCLTNRDRGTDMAVDQVSTQQSEHHVDDNDIDMADGTSRTTPMKGGDSTSHAGFPLVHGWAPPRQLDPPETDVSAKLITTDSNLKVTPIEDRDTKMRSVRRENSNVSDAMEATDFRCSENDASPHNATLNTSLDSTGFQSGGSDAGQIPSVITHPMINDLNTVKTSGPALLLPGTNDVQSLPHTLATPSVVPSPENDFHPPSTPMTSQDSSMIPPSSTETTAGDRGLPSVTPGGEPTLTDTTTTINGIIGISLSPQCPSSVPPSSTAEDSAPHDVPVPPPTHEQLRALHAFGPDTRTLLVYKGGNQKKLRFKIRFSILEEQYHAIIRWNNRKKPAEDLSMCTCASLACYSRASARAEQKSIEDISDLPVIWPTGGSLSMNVMYKGRLTSFPLSPPFKAGPNGLVDVSEYISLGENVIEFDQFDDMSAHIFVLRLHRPTGAQLEQIAERRQKDKVWNDWLLKMAEPMVVPIASFLK